MKKFLISLFISLLLILPVFSFADIQTEKGTGLGNGLVPCGVETQTTAVDTDPNTGELFGGHETVKNPCGFNDFITLINNIIYFLLFYMTVPICAIMFAYAGFLLVTAGGEAAHARTKAKSIFTNALLGLIAAFAAWIIIKFVLTILGYTNASWIGF